MKQLLLQTIACCAILLPFSQVEAKTFGEFKPGKAFTLTVDQVISVKTVGFTYNTKAAIPAGVPKFKKGQKVKFKIGKKGQLTAKGLSIPYKSDAGTSNTYFVVTTGTSSKADT